MNAMMKAEIMRSKPQLPDYFVRPLRSSLSPHYKRARDLQKTMAIAGDYMTTKVSLVNAQIELSSLAKQQERGGKRIRLRTSKNYAKRIRVFKN